MGEKDMIRRGWLSVGAAAMALVLLGASLPARSQEMALPERRALAAYQEKIYPGLEKAIQDAAGFAVPIEVDWPSIVIAGQAQNFAHEGFWTNIFFVPIKDALAAVASDAMGKQALKDKLKKIAITFQWREVRGWNAVDQFPSVVEYRRRQAARGSDPQGSGSRALIPLTCGSGSRMSPPAATARPSRAASG
jgi:hypothetical protein